MEKITDNIKQYSGRIKGEILSRRTFLGGSYFEYILVLLGLVLLTIIYTNFVAFHITTQLFAGSGDATAGFLWLNFADPSLNPFLHPTNYVNYPYGEVLGGPTFVTYSAIWLPLRVLSFLFGPIAGLNLVMFAGYVGAGLSMYWLVKRISGVVSVSLFAGYASAFVPYEIYQSSGHLAYIFSYVFVLIIAGFIALMLRPTRKRAILLSLAIALAFYTDGYYVLIASVLVIALCVSGIVYSILIKMTKGEVWTRFKGLFLTLCCLSILLIPIGYVQLSQGSQITKTLSSARSSISGELREYRSELVDFIVPAMSNPFFNKDGNFLAIHDFRNQKSNPGESTTYIGFTLIVLSVVGGVTVTLWFLLRKYSSLKVLNAHQRKQVILVACIVFCTSPILLSFMLSPDIHILGHRIPLPGALLVHYNIGLWRVMARFFIPLHVVVVLFAALGLWVLLTTSRIRNMKTLARQIITIVIVGILGIVLAFEYATTIYSPPYDFTKVQSGYRWLKDRSDIKVIAELPIVDPLDQHTTDYVTAQIVHQKKIVNFKEPSDKRLTNTLGFETNPETIDWAYSRGAQAIVTHGEACKERVSWGVLVFKDDSDLKSAMCIYTLVRPESRDVSFVRFGNGFIHSPNQPDPGVTVLSAGTAVLYVTGDSFAILPENLKVRLTAELTGSTSALIQGRWNIIQNGKVVSSGDIQGPKTGISADVSGEYPVKIRIDPIDNRVIGLGEFTLVDTKATDL